MASLLSPQDIKYQVSHIQESKTLGIVVGSSILISLATIAVVLRLWARKIRNSEHHGSVLAWDDHFVVIALLFAWSMFACIIYSRLSTLPL